MQEDNKHLIVRRLMALTQPMLNKTFNLNNNEQKKQVLSELAYRHFFRFVCQYSNSSTDGARWENFSQAMLTNLINVNTDPAPPNTISARFIEEVSAILRNYPFNSLSQYHFYYLDNNRPSFFMTLNRKGEPEYYCRTSLYRSYFVANDLPYKGYIAADVESALRLGADSRYLIEITLPLTTEIAYLDETMHRNQPTYNEYRWRMLAIDNYREIDRYDLHKLADIKKLKLRGLFYPFSNGSSGNKMALARWHATQSEANYTQAALCSLLEIEKIPAVYFPPYNRTDI